MRVTVDSYDGRGAIDYSDNVAAEGPLMIERQLNKPSLCTWSLVTGATAPGRLGRVVVTRADGTVLFTGYLPNEPELVYLGESAAGAVYRTELRAVSDDWLLDRQGLRAGSESFGLSGDASLRNLTNRVEGGQLPTTTTGQIATVGRLEVAAGKRWSANAESIMNAAGASYRVLAGEVQVRPLGVTRHVLSSAEGSLIEAGLRVAAKRELANDVALAGAMEAGSYVTEVFTGDGTTTEFLMSAPPFQGGSAQRRVVVADAFDEATLDPQRWTVADTGSHLTLGDGGLVLQGGNGLDGQTTLAATSAVELGGGLLLQATSVQLQGGSDGVILGLYSGPVGVAHCVAGFRVTQSNGATVLGALVNGVSAGTAVTLTTGHAYTLRVHVHATETQRVRQTYRVMVGETFQDFGGGLLDSPLDLVLELQDTGTSSNTPATVLYDGRLPNSPATASFVPVNSIQLKGSIGGISATRTAPVWVQSRGSAGTSRTRLAGSAGTGADFSLMTDGTLRFFPGRVPAAGEQLVVQSRRGQRSVARVQSAASVGTEGAGGLPGVAAWFGSVLQPAAASTEDCLAAAAATLAVGSERTAALAGSYAAAATEDVWPGDLLEITSGRGATTVLTRRVRLVDGGADAELILQEIDFANGWAAMTGLHLSESFPADAVVPAAPSSVTAPASLGGLQVIAVSQTAVQVDAGCPPPGNGGFEVRRGDSGFGPGEAGGLVLRSGVRGMTLPRLAQVERFYVRMYDGATPPNYSRVSSVIVTNVPVG